MAKERKALVVHYTPGDAAAEPAAELTAHLNDGWRLLSATAMGGAGGADAAGPHFAALVILEREEEKSVRGFGS